MLLFASLLCHRDVDIFKFNWFCSRIHLDHGFDIPHLILSDGSLTNEDKRFLRRLPNVIVEDEPITLYDVPKAPLLGKLECFKRGFEKFNASQVIVMDCDVFFFQNWDSDLRKICLSNAICMRDWGSSLGPNVEQYRNTFGVHEDLKTPNCNTGMMSITKDNYPKLEAVLEKYLSLETPFMMMEDQGALFAAYYGELSYIEGIVCVINSAEHHPDLWDWVKRQRGAHLMGMRVRPKGVIDLINYSLENLPKYVSLKQFSPTIKHISWGLMEYDTYNFTVPLQKIPSTSEGKHVTSGLYLHGGSRVKWDLPDRCKKFTTIIKCMDTGIPKNVHPITINGQPYSLNAVVNIELNGILDIITQNGPGSHIVFFNPNIELDKTWANMPENIMEKLNGPAIMARNK